MACLEDSQIHTPAAILVLYCERNLGRVQKHAGGPPGDRRGTVEDDRRRWSGIVSWMTWLPGRVRRRM